MLTPTIKVSILKRGKIYMFGIGLPELLIILIVVLIVFGPKKLPDLAKSLGKGMAEFKKVTDDFKSNIGGDLRDIQTDIEDIPKASIFNPPREAPSESQPYSETTPPDLIEPSANSNSATPASSPKDDMTGGTGKGA
jgi:sec-independent protein translocase protein TatA